MIPNLFILSSSGEILIEKIFVIGIKRTVCELFWEEVCKSNGSVDPVLATVNYYFCHIKRNGLFFVTCLQAENPPLFVLEFQQTVYSTLQGYFQLKIEESTLRDNFFLIMEVLDEMADSGFPLTTEMNALKEMVVPPSFVGKVMQTLTDESHLTGKIPEGIVSKIPWRKADCSYVQNEIYFDLVETVDAILNGNQSIVTCDIYGSVQCTCNLSGMPDLELSFNRPNLLSDAQLHRCIRINRYEKEKIISFVPPDGAFTLLSYRIDEGSQVPIYVKPQVTVSGTHGKIHLSVSPRFCDSKTIEDVVITLPIPKASSATFTTTLGNVVWDEPQKKMIWTIGTIVEGKSITLDGSFESPPSSEMLVISANFTVKLFALSGLKVENLVVQNVKYKPFRGIRFVTKAGHFQVRCNN